GTCVRLSPNSSVYVFPFSPSCLFGDVHSFPTRRSSDLEATLAAVARKLHLDGCLRLARGEENQGGRQRDSLLSDAMEAVFGGVLDRKSTRLNSSHVSISYAVFCLKKKNRTDLHPVP